MTDLKPKVPDGYKKIIPDLRITDAAVEELRRVCTEVHAHLDGALEATAASAVTFLYGGFLEDPWFAAIPIHNLAAVTFRPRGRQPFDIDLRIDWGRRIILAAAEVVLPDTYAVERVIAEARLDYV